MKTWAPRFFTGAYLVHLLLTSTADFLRSRHHHHSDIGRYVMTRGISWEDVAALVLILVAVAAGQQLLVRSTRRRSGTDRELAAGRVFAAGCVGPLLNVRASLVVEQVGWAWGAVFYGISVAFFVYLVQLYRAYKRAEAEEANM